MLQETFIALARNYTGNESLIAELWTEIEENYSGRERCYHTLEHLDHLLAQLNGVKKKIRDFDTILFTLFYHDIVYNSRKPDNEEQSAVLAEKRMTQLAVPDQQIERCKEQILATKSHHPAADSDTNYFTDADLSILGQSWEVYSRYFKNVRKEYAVYPDPVYTAGRKKVLKHFLGMPRIFKTDFFCDTFEKQAKENLRKEMELL